MNVREPEMSSLVLERQTFVIDAKQVHDCGMQVMNVDTIAHDVIAVLVGFAVRVPALHPATRHPH